MNEMIKIAIISTFLALLALAVVFTSQHIATLRLPILSFISQRRMHPDCQDSGEQNLIGMPKTYTISCQSHEKIHDPVPLSYFDCKVSEPSTTFHKLDNTWLSVIMYTCEDSPAES